MSASTSVTVDTSGLDAKFSPSALKAAQTHFAQRVAFVTRQYVPVDEGTLRDSEPASSDYANGEITWNTPYAQKVYNADGVRTVKNPKAAPHWAEHAKQEHMQDFAQYAAALLTGKGGKAGGR